MIINTLIESSSKKVIPTNYPYSTRERQSDYACQTGGTIFGLRLCNRVVRVKNDLDTYPCCCNVRNKKLIYFCKFLHLYNFSIKIQLMGSALQRSVQINVDNDEKNLLLNIGCIFINKYFEDIYVFKLNLGILSPILSIIKKTIHVLFVLICPPICSSAKYSSELI